MDPSVSIPYWDSNLDFILGDDLATNSIMWTPDFMGNGAGDVVTGPFADWLLPTPDRRKLWRNLTAGALIPESTSPSLMSDESIIKMFSGRRLRDLSWFVDTSFERNHGATHNWVGGVMANLPLSPSDPVFLLHHAFIDCLWEQFRDIQRSQKLPEIDPRYDYPNDSHALGVGMVQPDGVLLRTPEQSHHHAQATMEPFGPLRNIDGLRDGYFDRYYTCEPSPVCSTDAADCGSEHLFCDLNTYRCAPKLQLGAICTDFAKSSPCHRGVCCSGVCRPRCSSRNEAHSEDVSQETVTTVTTEAVTDTTTSSPTDVMSATVKEPYQNNETPIEDNDIQTNPVVNVRKRPPTNRLLENNVDVNNVRFYRPHRANEFDGHRYSIFESSNVFNHARKPRVNIFRPFGHHIPLF